MTDQGISYVVGEEKRLTDIVGDADVLPLLRGAVRAGVSEASVIDADGALLWVERNPAARGAISESIPIRLEGEVVGSLVVTGERGEDYLKGIAGLLSDALNNIIATSLKRMLTTEIHTDVVNRSYEELIETNRRLAVSERNYRELALSLELKVEERTRELKQAHTRLLQQEKMASVGQLAAGVAHEINNPLGFVLSNLATLRKYVARFVAMLDCYRGLLDLPPPGEDVQRLAGQKWRELKLDIVYADVGDLLTQSIDGADRVRRIVADLKGFSHVDDGAEGVADMNLEIDRTLGVLSHWVPAGAEIVRDYRPLPGFFCNPALICQVFLNIMQNAFQARPEGLRLMIETRSDGAEIRISFADNGPGIPEAARGRIFEPFYTTRDVGAGTGMGLAVVYDIVAQYGGTVAVACPEAGGSVFTVSLPAKRG